MAVLRFALDGEKYEFDTARLMNFEAIAIKRVTTEQWGFQDWLKALSESDVEALTALVWILRKRAGDDTKFTETQFNLMEMLETFSSDGEETDAESDPTPSTTTPSDTSPPSLNSSESVSGSSTT